MNSAPQLRHASARRGMGEAKGIAVACKGTGGCQNSCCASRTKSDMEDSSQRKGKPAAKSSAELTT